MREVEEVEATNKHNTRHTCTGWGHLDPHPPNSSPTRALHLKEREMMATNANEAPARYQRRTFPTVGGLTRIEVMIFVLAFTQMEPLFIL